MSSIWDMVRVGRARRGWWIAERGLRGSTAPGVPSIWNDPESPTDACGLLTCLWRVRWSSDGPEVTSWYFHIPFPCAASRGQRTANSIRSTGSEWKTFSHFLLLRSRPGFLLMLNLAISTHSAHSWIIPSLVSRFGLERRKSPSATAIITRAPRRWRGPTSPSKAVY